MICDNQNQLSQVQKHAPWWKGSGPVGRADLLQRMQQIMHPHQMLQPNRLESLMSQAISYQLSNCKYHNVLQQEYSLL